MKIIIEVPNNTLAVNVTAVNKINGIFNLDTTGYDINHLEKIVDKLPKDELDDMINNKKKKVLISQPMGSRTYEEVLNNRLSLKQKLEDAGYEVLDNLFTDTVPSDVVNEKIYYLSKAIDLMTRADLIVFMDEWEDSRGCIIEHDIAIAYSLNIQYESQI